MDQMDFKLTRTPAWPIFPPFPGPEKSLREPRRIAVFASGGGTNLQALIDHFNPAPAPAARVELVVASRAGIGALARAERSGIASVVLDARETGAGELAGRMLAELERHRIDLVALAGWLQLVPAE